MRATGPRALQEAQTSSVQLTWYDVCNILVATKTPGHGDSHLYAIAVSQPGLPHHIANVTPALPACAKQTSSC
jgi:hypothetical protein